MPIYSPLVSHYFLPTNEVIIAHQYPELRFSKERLETFAEYGKFKHVFHLLPYDGIDFHIDNRHVSLHADEKVSGGCLVKFEQALDVLMPIVAGTEKVSIEWNTGRSRIGYKLTRDTKKLPDDQRQLVLNQAMNALMGASNAFGKWLRERGSDKPLWDLCKSNA